MRPFEEAVASELTGLLRAGVPARGVHLTVRDWWWRASSGAARGREVSETMEASVRAAAVWCATRCPR